MFMGRDARVGSYHTPQAPLMREATDSGYPGSPETARCDIRLSARNGSTAVARRASRGGTERNPGRRTGNRWRSLLVRFAIAGLVVGSMAGLAARDLVTARFPSLAPAYAAIGLPVNPVGLAIEDVRARFGQAGDKKYLGIEGWIVNLRAAPARSPDLKFAVRDSGGEALYVWTTRAPDRRLERGERVHFAARLEAPPEGANDAIVQFVGTAQKSPLGAEGS